MFENYRQGKRYEYLQAFASRASQLARRLATVSLILRAYGLMQNPNRGLRSLSIH